MFTGLQVCLTVAESLDFFSKLSLLVKSHVSQAAADMQTFTKEEYNV